MFIDFLRARFAAAGSDTAFVHRDVSSSYADLLAGIDAAATALDTAGVGPGAVVALEAECTPASVAALLALIARACIVAPLTPTSWDDTTSLRAIGQVEWRVTIADDGTPVPAATGTAADHDLYARLRGDGHPGLVLFSSGSTGAPKGTVHDLSRLLAKYHTPRRNLSTLMFLLFDHIGGLDTLFYCLSNASRIVLVEARTPAAVLAAVERHRVEVLPVAPSFLNLMLLSGEHERHDLSSLRYVTYGAEMMPPETLARCAEAFPNATMLQKYGTSEVGTLRSHSKENGSLWVKIGGEGYEWRVREGKLEIKAASAMLGYLNARSPFTEDGWFMTGDCVETDGEYLRFLGRESDIVNVGGQKVFPAEVEAVIREMDNVRDVSVMGERNPILGQVVAARVQLIEDEPAAALRTRLKKFVGARLEAFKVPARIEITADSQVSSRFKQIRRPDGPAPQ